MILLIEPQLGVVPILVGPLQALIALLPVILAALASVLLALLKPRNIWLMVKLLWRQKIGVLLVVGCVAGAAWGISRLRDSKVSGVAQIAGEWGNFRGGPQRLAFVPGTGDPTAPGVIWEHVLPKGSAIYSSPAVVGDYVFISTLRVTAMDVNGEGDVLCLNAHTGELIWSDGMDDRRATFSSPSVVGDFLAVGEGLHKTKDSRISVYDSRDGHLAWAYRTASHSESSPVITGDTVVFGAGRDGYYAFKLKPGPDGKPERLWHAPGAEYMDASGSPNAHAGMVYLPLGRWGGRGVASVDAQTGKEAWRVRTPYPVFSGPTIAPERGLLLIGMGNGNFVQTAEEAMESELSFLRSQGVPEAEVNKSRAQFGPAGAVWAVDLASGEKRWAFECELTVLGQVAASELGVFFGSSSGVVYRLDYEGNERARWNAHSSVVTSVAVAGSHVYVVTAAGGLHCLEAESLKPVWEMGLGGTGGRQLYLGSPSVAHGHVYVGTPDGRLLCVGKPSPPAKISWAVKHGTNGGGVWGSVKIPDKPAQGWFVSDTAATGPLALMEGALLVPTSTGLVCRAEKDGAELWRYPVSATPVVEGNVVAFVADGVLTALNASDGSELWHRKGVQGEPLLDGALYVGGMCLNAQTGEQLWDSGLDAVVGAPALRHGRIVYTTSAELVLLDSMTGQRLWAVPERASFGAVFAGDLVIACADDRVFALNERDGQVRWQVKMAPTGRVIVGERVVMVRDRDDQLHVLDLSTGNPRHVFEGVTDRPMSDGSSVYIMGSRGYHRMLLESGERERWLRWESEWGAPTVPPASANGRIFIGTDSGILMLEGSER